MEALHIDVVVKGEVFARQARQQARRQRVCPPPFDDDAGNTYWVDRVEICDDTTFTERTVPRPIRMPVGLVGPRGVVTPVFEDLAVPVTSVIQPVSLFLTDVATLRRWGLTGPSSNSDYATPVIAGRLHVEVGMNLSGEAPALTTELVDIRVPLLELVRNDPMYAQYWQLFQRQKPALIAQLAPLVRTSRQVDLRAASSLVRRDLRPVNAAVGYNSETDVFVIRMEVSRNFLTGYEEQVLFDDEGIRAWEDDRRIAATNQATRDLWARFGEHRYPSVPEGDEEWSVFLHRHLLTSPIARQVWDGLLTRADRLTPLGTTQPGSDRRGQARSFWEPTASAIRVRMPIDVRLLRVCDCFIRRTDVDVEVMLTFDLSLTGTGQVQIDVDVRWRARDAALFCCEVTAALFWPAIGAILLAEGRLEPGAYIGTLAVWVFLGAVWIFIGALSIAATYRPNLPTDLLVGVRCERRSDNELRCTMNAPRFALPGLPPLQLARLGAVGDGAVLAGRLGAARDARPGAIRVDAVSAEFLWADLGTCRSDPAYHASASFRLTNVGGTPLFVCGVTALDDPAGLYTGGRIRGVPDGALSPGAPVTVTVALPEDVVERSLNGAPPGERLYGCQLVIQTSAGTRLVTIPSGPSAITDEERRYADQVKRLGCSPVAKVRDELLRMGEAALPPLMGDPSPDARIAAELWQVILTDIAPQAQVVLDQGDIAASVRADEKGAAAISTLGRAGKRPRLSVLGARAENAPKPDIHLQQDRFETDVEVFVGKDTRLLAYADSRRGGQVAIHDGTALVWLELAVGEMPHVLFAGDVGEISGAVVRPDGLLVWGSTGASLLTGTGEQKVKLGDVGSLRSLVEAGDRLITVGSEKAVVLGEDGADLGAASSALWVEPSVLVLAGDTIRILTFEEKGEPREVGSMDLRELGLQEQDLAQAVLEPYPLPLAGQRVAVLRVGDVRALVDVTNPGSPRAVGTVAPTTSGLVATAVYGRHLVTLEHGTLSRAVSAASVRL